MIIAVDGPTASGKGTLARALADHYGLPHLDTGLLYRAVGSTVEQQGGDPDVEADALAGCAFAEALLGDPVLRSERVGALASRVSRHPAVRAALLDRQRRFAAQSGGAVLDGRDIGTVVAPEAEVKLFVTASLEERARRRMEELRNRGQQISLEQVSEDVAARDERDSGRAAAPLRPATDAILLDTSGLAIADVVRRAIALTDGRMRALGQSVRAR